MSEAAFIKALLAPLTLGLPEADNLLNDAAVLPAQSQAHYVVTTDTLAAGVHFIGNEEPRYLAQKALRVNLSDLAAMGATPLYYLLNLSLPHTLAEQPAWLENFVQGLKLDQRFFGISLLGGDTITTSSPLQIGITAIGTVDGGNTLLRRTAKAGDALYVSGTIGDACVGMQELKQQSNPQTRAAMRYLLPDPRLELGRALVGLANAAMDVSDGLLLDVQRLASASGLQAVINVDSIPIAEDVAAGGSTWKSLAVAGDDYELLWAMPHDLAPALHRKVAGLDTKLTHIGYLETGEGLRLVDKQGQAVALPSTLGYQHL